LLCGLRAFCGDFLILSFGLTKQSKVRDLDVRRLLDAYPRIYFACHTRHVRDAQTGEDVSAHQTSILDHLDEVDAISVSDLAGHMGVTVATMSLAIDRLERKGYARRERDPKDGRRVLLRATPAGIRLREAKSVLDPVRVEQLLARLSPADRETALEGLQMLARASGSWKPEV
jgi:MarR family transcriptional regulator, organic hydroperoxide resistance regulator